ncbi:NAD-dependent epimerase/dehydratase family protein [Candidatus Ferrigenium straubiae]|uniref:NAD-dependent epimerase/dehydratase family protein n=1 Tax=Candidatus Ferrigenium straubiae TaxID=2919506 RepID=UPI003F4AD2C3
MSDVVLLTGGLGYVGGRISHHLLEASDYHLRIGTRDASQPKPEWLGRGEIVSLDLLDEASLAAACRGVKCVIHLAALNEIDSAADPEQALMINGLGSLKLLRAAIRAGVERFIYFSTAHVYGSPLAGRLTEESLPRPQHPYAITHRTAEDFVLAARDKNEIDGIVVRLSNGFGAPERAEVNRWSLLANDLCRQAVTAKKLVLRSSGLQYRDFITLTDVGRAVLHLLDLAPEACGDGLFNLGGEAPLRIIDVAEKVAERCEAVLGFRPEIHKPPSSADEQVLSLDYRMDRLKGTGFYLLANIDEEIEATLRLCQRSFGQKG